MTDKEAKRNNKIALEKTETARTPRFLESHEIWFWNTFYQCRCIRADKVATGVQSFVVSKMGDRFVKPPVFDLNACFDDSSCATPLVFILSPGSDPMGAVLKAADGMGVKVINVQSLGRPFGLVSV